MPPTTNYDIISRVQPTAVASEGISVFGQGDGREESQRYQGVQKIKDRPIYVGHVCDNDHATKSKRTIYLGALTDKQFGQVNLTRTRTQPERDLVTLKLWGSCVQTNFPESHYKRALEAMANMSQMEVVGIVRRLSFTFSKSVSQYHGVSRHITGKWQASFGVGSRNKFLGIFDTEEEAARAFDVESIRLRGHEAITNFEIKLYNVRAILQGETDEEVIYQSKDNVEAIQPLEVLQNIIGTSIIFNNTGTGNGEGEPNLSTNYRPEMQIPIGVSGDTEEQANVALASRFQQDICDTTLSLAVKGPPSDYRSEGNGKGCSALLFQHATSSDFKEYKRRKVGEPSDQVDVPREVQKAVN